MYYLWFFNSKAPTSWRLLLPDQGFPKPVITVSGQASHPGIQQSPHSRGGFCCPTRVSRSRLSPFRDRLLTLVYNKAPTLVEAFVARPGFEPGLF